MAFSRRALLRTLAYSGSAALVAPPPLCGLSSNTWSEPPRLSESGRPIRLDSNENAYGPSKKAVAAMSAALLSANRYPDMEYDALAERIAKLHGIGRDHLLLGCGSTEILRVAAAAFLGKDRQLVQANPTFGAMEHYAQAASAQVISVRLNSDFAHDFERMLQHVSENTGIVYICNPNNPTASITPRTELEVFIKKVPANTYVLIDEAYHHYASQSARYASFIDQPLGDDRVIVSRTFSAVYGLAGLRLGYAVGSPEALQRMGAHTTDQGINCVVTQAALAALDDTESVRDSVKRNADDRQEFRNQAMVRMLKPIDSHANFLMMDTQRPAHEVIEHFRKYDVFIGRVFPAMHTYIRVSLGTPQEMLAFWRVWDLLPFAQMQMSH
jgi:histidinol-phosphate aminotransferase